MAHFSVVCKLCFFPWIKKGNAWVVNFTMKCHASSPESWKYFKTRSKLSKSKLLLHLLLYLGKIQWHKPWLYEPWTDWCLSFTLLKWEKWLKSGWLYDLRINYRALYVKIDLFFVFVLIFLFFLGEGGGGGF